MPSAPISNPSSRPGHAYHVLWVWVRRKPCHYPCCMAATCASGACGADWDAFHESSCGHRHARNCWRKSNISFCVRACSSSGTASEQNCLLFIRPAGVRCPCARLVVLSSTDFSMVHPCKMSPTRRQAHAAVQHFYSTVQARLSPCSIHGCSRTARIGYKVTTCLPCKPVVACCHALNLSHLWFLVCVPMTRQYHTMFVCRASL